MSDHPPNKSNPQEEIDLGQLFTLIGNVFNGFFRWLLRLFLYLKRNLVILISLIIIGALIGFGLNFIVGEEQKLDVIVTPNMDTKNYLYDVITEVQSDIKAKDTTFFASLEMDIDKMEGFKIEISPVLAAGDSGSEEEMKFLEVLKDFERSEAISDILRSELQDRTTKDHRITFYFKNQDIATDYAQKILGYINSNAYYTSLLRIYTENAQTRIKQNDSLIAQIDVLIRNYSEKILKDQATAEGRLVLDNQESLDVPSLFTLKNELILDTESKKVELERRKDAITVVNFGKPHKVQKPLYKKNIALIPILLAGIFVLISIIRYLNRRAIEIQND